MAGAGYKLFATNDVLTAAQVNTYLNEQSVMVFATTAARDSALTSVLAEGMVCYVEDITGSGTAGMSVYTGSAWKIMWSEWEDFTVSWAAGVTVGNGTYPINRYAWIAPDVYCFEMEFLLGTTSAITGYVELDFPQGAVGARVANSLNVTLSNVGTDYSGFARSRNLTLCRLQCVSASGTYAVKAELSSTVPFTWAAGDRIVVSGTVGV